MSLLSRYTLGEFLKVLLVTLVVATALMIVVGVSKEAIQNGLGFAQIVPLLPYILPEALRFAVPGTTLFAACSVFGRMSAANEVVAVKALGISPLVLLRPVLVASCLLSFASLWLNDMAVSWGRDGIRRVIIESVEEIAYNMLRAQRSYGNNRFSISVMKVEGQTLVQPTITFQPNGDRPAVVMLAESGRLETNPEENTLTVVMQNGSIQIGEQYRVQVPGELRREIPLPDASTGKSLDVGGPSQMPMWRIPAEIESMTVRMEENRDQLAARAAYQTLTGDFGELTSERWLEEHGGMREAEVRLHRLYTEPHRRWANSLSCLCFVLVGAPLAIRLRNSDFLTSFFLCFMPILLVYYPLLAWGTDRAKSGAMPPYTVWLGDAILVLAGAWILRKVMRY
ncbi:MAG: LptF/LptG family permease [Pirellulales bacterium]